MPYRKPCLGMNTQFSDDTIKQIYQIKERYFLLIKEAEKYGKKLIATHINDNLGIKDVNGRITWTNDLHLCPLTG